MSLTIIPDNSYHSMRNANKGAQVGNATLTDANLRSQAQVDGMKLFTEWMSKRGDDIQKNILSSFDENGVSLEPLSATTFSDLYKWTMMPVIRKLEAAKGEITVTFGIDLRESDMRQAMMDDRALVDQIHDALTSLTKRMFDPAIFEAVNGIKGNILDSTTIEDICGTKASPRALVQEVKPLYTTPFDTPPTPGQVTLYMYKKTCDESTCTPYTYEKDKGNSKKKGTVSEGGQVYFIEAVGPWHKVTWLETSMMQCVYEAKLRYDLEKKTTYGKWLYGALLRCAKSVAYTRLVQKYQTEGKLGKTMTPILPALFTGRRTGGFAFILLQNLFFADHFEQYSPENLKITPHCALGTSSVDAWSILTKGGMKCRTPAGTNAHELRMVTQILYPEIDTLASNLPLTQVLVDLLYQREVQSKTGGPMPTLPDTLGTRAYLKAATYIKGKDGKPFLTQITSARQDSGELRVFIDNMNEFGYGFPAKSIMASEIDTSKTLLEAAELGYQHFGAGGFFGDSEKVWSINPEAPSNSMAVKAVRVSYKEIPGGFPFILNGVGYPVKLGDASGKMSLDKNLNSEQFRPIKAYYDAIKAAAVAPAAEVQGSMTVDELLREAALTPAAAEGGRQHQRLRLRLRKSQRKTKHGRYAKRSTKRSGSGSGSTKTRR